MSDLRPSGITVDLGGQERRLLFTLNAIDVLQDEFGQPIGEIIGSITDDSKSHSAIIAIVTALLNDEAEREKVINGTELPTVTKQMVGWLITQENYADIFVAVLKAYGCSMPDPEEDSDPNRTSRQD